MQFSENWLRTWVNPAISTAKMIELFTALGHELDECTPVADTFSNVVVGEVLVVMPHPDADKLRVCTVSVSSDCHPCESRDPGSKEKLLNIVCGASNVRPGLKVAVALIGAELKGGEIKIKRSKLRGVESEGMLCSAVELGLAESSEGIMELPFDAPLGNHLRDYLQLDDQAIRLDLTPNRGDCLSVRGLARELALISGTVMHSPFSTPAIEIKNQTTPQVFIDDILSCGRYVGRIISGIDNTGATPLWLKERLRRSGLRSISPVVDVTNYVLLELGQPLHAFDANKLQGHIHVRKAKAGETLALLDGKNIELDPSTLVIADDHRALALAGIMGGTDSAVDANTHTIFLESAYFTPLALAGQARRYGLHTDSAHRFERGVDWQLQHKALDRATELLLAISGGIAGQIVEVTSDLALPNLLSLSLRKARVQRILGFNIDEEEIENILHGLGMHVVLQGDKWQVEVPSFRADIREEIDLIEEIVRVYGYDRIPPHLPMQVLMPVKHSDRTSDQYLSTWLMGRGYQELITYSFVDQKNELFLFPEAAPLALQNPISAELGVMRTSLWQGLLQAVRYNQNRQQERIRFFEIGKVYTKPDQHIQEKWQIAGVMTGLRVPLQWGASQEKVDFFDLKGDVEALLEQFHLGLECTFKAENSPCLHPRQSVALYQQGKKIGVLGALHPAIAAKWDLIGPVLMFELDLEALTLATLPKFATLSKYPAVRRDLAFTLAEGVPYGRVEAVIRSQKAPFELMDVRLFDVYQGQGVATHHKSLAIALILQHRERTLIDEEINDWMAKVVHALSTDLGAVLRS